MRQPWGRTRLLVVCKMFFPIFVSPLDYVRFWETRGIGKKF